MIDARDVARHRLGRPGDGRRHAGRARPPPRRRAARRVTATIDEAARWRSPRSCFAQLFNCFNARSDRTSAFHHLFTNRWLWGAIAISVVLQVAVVELSFLNNAFGTTPLALEDWLICLGLASVVLWADEAKKLARTPAAPLGVAAPRLNPLLWLSVAAAVTTIAQKGLAWQVTGSVGLLSDAVELFAKPWRQWPRARLRWAMPPPDDEHSFGHGQADYFAAGAEGS